MEEVLAEVVVLVVAEVEALGVVQARVEDSELVEV